jgi:D-alanyl-D-alanine carboxypeptidase (penicillin-binding protein 5/6)
MIAKRLVLCLILLATLVAAPPLYAQGDLQLASRSAILADAATGRVLFAKNADLPLQPASITKVLTLFIADEMIRDGRVHPRDVVKVSRKAGKTGGSRMFIQAGSEISLEELLKGMAVVSANDASVAVAEHLGGTVEAFVTRMNLKARELGMKHSVFFNPNGLPAKGQQTTARDMLILSREYLRCFPESLQLHSQQEFTYRKITQHNRNALLKRYPTAAGIKTGWVQAAG